MDRKKNNTLFWCKFCLYGILNLQCLMVLQVLQVQTSCHGQGLLNSTCDPIWWLGFVSATQFGGLGFASATQAAWFWALTISSSFFYPCKTYEVCCSCDDCLIYSILIMSGFFWVKQTRIIKNNTGIQIPHFYIIFTIPLYFSFPSLLTGYFFKKTLLVTCFSPLLASFLFFPVSAFPQIFFVYFENQPLLKSPLSPHHLFSPKNTHHQPTPHSPCPDQPKDPNVFKTSGTLSRSILPKQKPIDNDDIPLTGVNSAGNQLCNQSVSIVINLIYLSNSVYIELILFFYSTTSFFFKTNRKETKKRKELQTNEEIKKKLIKKNKRERSIKKISECTNKGREFILVWVWVCWLCWLERRMEAREVVLPCFFRAIMHKRSDMAACKNSCKFPRKENVEFTACMCIFPVN
ncbi:putative signal peptide protein [Puccinia sorghi]|uniref:Putative signal peptide protein n=1 Tax=Puccinia sorghi TaxID=27349 RepID=A0A0L6UMP6_9BASI|nr:putative signal peptide protein [Puccinia sorghi]